VENVEAIIEEYDVILDCTDNIETKYILNDACYLAEKTLVQVGIYQWEGQLRVMLAPQKGCLRCLWPSVPEPGCVGTCTDGGVLGVIPNIFGHLQAMEALRIILGMQSVFENEMLLFNIADFQFRRLKIRPDENCPLCSSGPSITSIAPEHYRPKVDYILSAPELSDEALRGFRLVDVREAQEAAQEPVRGFECELMPLSDFTEDQIPFDKDNKYLLICSKGVRSSRLAAMVREMGYDNVYSLKDGMSALKTLQK
jgi:adenylyltransferase/sulfurtransferase